jgi:hypothetical protein
MLKKLLLAVAVPLALVAAPLTSHAVNTATILTDTPTQLNIVWSGTLSAFSSLAVPTPTNWALLGFYSNVASQPIFGQLVETWTGAVQVQHAVPDPGPYPHGNENKLGPIYTSYLSGSMGSGGYDSKMGDHNGQTLQFPADWVTPHWDHYSFQVISNVNGTGTMELKALHPVPEPASYALLLGGLGWLGVIARRRNLKSGR